MTSQFDAPDGGPGVDLVYAWVDGDDPELQADMRRYASGSGDLNPERTRDLYDLLRYSLRSVAMFAGWIRNIHIITRRPQVPAWLDLSNPRVHVVHHDELSGFAHIYDRNGDGQIDALEAALRAMANDIYSAINEQGGI